MLLALGGVFLVSHRSGADPGHAQFRGSFPAHIPAPASAALAPVPGLARNEVPPAAAPLDLKRSEVLRSETRKLRKMPYEAWELNEQEWSRYLELMRGPRGLWSPQLDPVSVLGVHATSDEERRLLAERFVLMQDRRVQGELAFQRTVNEVLERFYGELPVVDTPPATPPVPPPAEKTPATAGDELLLLAPVSCRQECRELLRRAQSAVREQGHPLHIYLAQAVDDEAIRHWALGMGVDRRAVFERRITLNHQDEVLRRPDLRRFAGTEPRLLLRRNGSLQEYLP